MIGSKTQEFADLLVNYCVAVQPGESVGISSPAIALPLTTEIFRAVVRAGGHPYVTWLEESFAEILLKEGGDDQLNYVSPMQRLAVESLDCTINVNAPRNTRTLSGVAPERQRLRQSAMRDVMDTYMQRAAVGDLRWCTTLFPTDASAQEADMSLSDFAAFVFGACHLDKDDPVAAWQAVSHRQQKLVDWLAGKKQVIVRGPNADLSLSIEDRVFLNDDGHFNMPGGEIFTGPVESSVEGWVRFSYPAITNGREVEGIELRFENGQVVEASARKNEAFLQAVLDTDPGARYLGEFAIGTNDGIRQFTKSILFDEKIGGTMHMAIGASYPESGGQNQSAVHWDMICDMRDGGRIWVDGELFYESGRFPLLDE